MTWVGIDENGLGPVLGPFVATGVSVRGRCPPAFHPVLADSKRVFHPGQEASFRRIEATALAAARLAHGSAPDAPADFLRMLTGKTGCGAAHPFCWDLLPSSVVWARRADIEEMAALLNGWLASNGCHSLRISSRIVCPAELNACFAAGTAKSAINFEAFSALIQEMAEDGATVDAGRVGGMRYYGKRLRDRFPDAAVSALRETADVSQYLIHRDARIAVSFRRDVEETSALACLASIVGKYVRELFMEAVNRALGTAERVSGYRDPRTRTALTNIPANLSASCLIRDR